MRRRLFLGAMLAALAVVALVVGWTVADPGPATALAVARAVRLVAIAALTGLLVLTSVVWAPLRRAGETDAAADEAFARVGRRALRWFAVLGALGAAAALGLYAADEPGRDVVDALGSRVGAWLAVSALAFAGIALLASTVLGIDSGGRRRWATWATAGLVVGLNLAPALGGHAAIGSPAAVLVVIETVHVVGMGAWVGGLLGLLIVLPPAARARPAGPARTALIAAALLRFSPVALTAVVALTSAGTALSLLSLTTLYDLADTAYGRAIFVKVVLLLVAISLAVLQREYLVPRLERAVAAGRPADGSVPQGRGPDGAPPVEAAVAARHVRAALRGEALLLVAVLVVTGALAGYPTPKSLADRPATVTRVAAGLELRAEVTPARAGENDLRLTVRGSDGRLAADARVVGVRAVPPGRAGSSDTPVDVTVRSVGPGRWAAAEVPLGARGRWKVEVALRTPDRGRVAVTLPVRVR